jgi:hypothetical protein
MDEVTTFEGEEPKPRKVRGIKRTPVAPPSEQSELQLGELEAPQVAAPKPLLKADPVIRLFFACLVAGLLTTTLALFENDTARRIGLLGPLVATAAYPLIGWFQGIATRPSARERFADNCYYLGFIFTQAALFLVFLPSTMFDRPLESKDILGFFGMALSAALTGLISRTILVQLGSSLPEADDAVHEEVEEVARQVSKRAREIVQEFAGMADAAGTVTTTLNSSLDQLTGSLDRFDDVLQRELATFERGVGTIEVTVDGAQEAIATHKQSFGKQVESAGAALVALQANLDARAKDALSSLAEVTSALQQGSAAMNGLGELAPGVEALNEKLEGIDELASDVSRQRATLTEAVDASLASLATTSQRGAEGITEAASGAAQALQQSGTEAGEELKDHARKFDENLAATTERLATALKQFRDELDRLTSERKALSDAP